MMVAKILPATIFSLICVLAVYNGQAQAEIFSSMDQLIRLPPSISKLPAYLNEFLRIQEEKLLMARKMIDKYELTGKAANKDAKKFMGNPVNSFLVIKLLTKELQMFFDFFNSIQESKEFMDKLRTELWMPDEEDYRGAVASLIRLEDTYLLTPKDVRNGVFGQSKSMRKLNALECFEFGRIAHENENHFHAVRWLNEALSLLDTDEAGEFSMKKAIVLEYLAFSHFKQGDISKALKITRSLIELEPHNQKFKDNLGFYKRALADRIVENIDVSDVEADFNNTKLTDLVRFDGNKTAIINEHRPHTMTDDEREKYERLCREEIPNEKMRAQLKCRYINWHPLLRIAPIKQEQAFKNPDIFVYYDILTEKQAEKMIELARPRLDRARISSTGPEGKGSVSNIRISKNGWLNDQQADFFPRLSNLVEAITNLSMKHAEDWQMNNYGLGGVYEPHEDFSRKTNTDHWDGLFGLRLATWMFYVEAPEIGGATVFPTAGARVSPVNRSAVFWYNLLPSGEGDYRSRHAACPVVVGSKWVSNKWVRAKGQEFHRPCTLVNEENESIFMVK